MVDYFIDAKRKLRRAGELVGDLHTRIERFFNNDPIKNVVEPHPDGESSIHKLKLATPIPDDLHVVAADALANMRSALDQSCYAAAISSGKTNPRSCSFPFGTTAAHLENKIKGACKDLPKEIVDYIRSVEPHAQGNRFLWTLNNMRASNEHMSLTLAGASLSDIYIDHMSVQGSAPLPPRWDRSKNELILGVTRKGGEIESNMRLSFFIEFSGIDILAGHAVVDVLNHMGHIVDNIVVNIESISIDISTDRSS